MQLAVSAGQHSGAGRKPVNQDAHGLCIPPGPQLAAKGVAAVVADGISTSADAREASHAAVQGFLADYYCTSEAWSVKQSASRVLAAMNSWLYAQTQRGAGRFDKDRGWVCTLSALVLRSRTAHLFHVGDARIWQLQGETLEPLTRDHRVPAGGGTSYLGRALGVAGQVEIDYRAVPLQVGDVFVLTTDGVHEHVRPRAMAAALARHAGNLGAAAQAIAEEALAAGSDDNLTVQVVRIDALPLHEHGELARRAGELAPAPALSPRMAFEGWRIVRELHASSRSHVWLAVDEATQAPVALKVPATELQADPQALEAFLREEWVARRVDSPHLLKPAFAERARGHLYSAMEYVEGRTLAQWMVDHPRPALDAVRSVVEQVARGLRALHRLEMVHQDLRPENVLLDATGTARIIDFGAVHVPGLAEAEPGALPGALECTAPERFLGEPPSARGDLYALAALTYRMLGGALPYGLEAARCRSVADLRKLRYRPLLPLRPDLPSWVDDALRKALQPEPHKRYADVAEFVHCLRQPDPALHRPPRMPLAQRHPVLFWQAASLVLGLACTALLGLRAFGR